MSKFIRPERQSSKWRRFEPDVLPMHVAEMDFEVAKEVRDVLASMVQRSDLGYLGPVPEAAEAFGDFAKRRWNWEIDRSAFRIATDVGVAAVELLRILTKPGDSVLVNFPVYASFQGWLKEVGAKPHDVPLIRDGQSWRLDVPGIEKAFQEGVKVYLLCSPQNPVGLIHSESDLRAIAALARKYDAVVISDEIHAPLAWQPFTAFLALGEDAEAVGITISSSSKAFNTAGLKAAFLITQSEEIRRKIARLPEALHFRAAILGAFAMAASFQHGDSWLDQTIERIRQNYIFLGELLAKELPKAKLTEMSSTYLAFIDLAEYGISHPAKKLLDEGRVALVAGSDHSNDGNYQSFVRFNFATSQENIAEAVSRMKQVLVS